MCDLSVEVNFREMEVMLRGHHPNLIRCEALYFHQGSDSQHLYVVTDVYRFGDLQEYVLQRSELSEPESGLVISQVASVLRYLRDVLNCMHRDIKPANILIKSQEGKQLGEVVLCDLGWTVVRPDSNVKLVRTQTANAGTVGWRAPEVEAEEGLVAHYNNKCDIFSLGLVAYFCLTGGALKHNDVVVSEQWPGRLRISGDMKELVEVMLEPDVNKRATIEHIFASSVVPTAPEIEVRDDDIDLATHPPSQEDKSGYPLTTSMVPNV